MPFSRVSRSVPPREQGAKIRVPGPKGHFTMHMDDSLLSPQVALTFLGVGAIALALASRKLSREDEGESRLPLTGVLAAFVFAAQMVNFKIPATGSSGHFVGALLLAVLLGPGRALVCMAAVLLLQALVFGDGGVLALGCNFFNMGLVGAIGGWWFYRLLAGTKPGTQRRAWSAALAAWVSIVAGSAMVVVETTLSGRVELPFLHFLGVMAGIHAFIGIGEGLITWGVVRHLLEARPTLIEEHGKTGKLEIGLGLATLAVGGGVSLFASPLQDGLEHALVKMGWTPSTAVRYETWFHDVASKIQEGLSFLPGYKWTTLSGILGTALTFLAVMGALWLLYGRSRRKRDERIETLSGKAH